MMLVNGDVNSDFMVVAFSCETSSTAAQVPNGGSEPAKYTISALPEVYLLRLFYQVCMRLELCGLGTYRYPTMHFNSASSNNSSSNSGKFKGRASKYVLWKFTKSMNCIFRIEKHWSYLHFDVNLRPLWLTVSTWNSFPDQRPVGNDNDLKLKMVDRNHPSTEKNNRNQSTVIMC